MEIDKVDKICKKKKKDKLHHKGVEGNSTCNCLTSWLLPLNIALPYKVMATK